MKTPLIRQGGGQQALVTIYEDRADRQRAIDKMISAANATDTEQERRWRGIVSARTAAGDERRLRMIPAIARGVAGAIPGTKPGCDLL